MFIQIYTLSLGHRQEPTTGDANGAALRKPFASFRIFIDGALVI
jgi:hypothetical protein